MSNAPPNAPTASVEHIEEKWRRFAVYAFSIDGYDTLTDEQRRICRDAAAWSAREVHTALLAARRERETAYETTAQVRDALSEEILKLRDHLAAARRERDEAQQKLENIERSVEIAGVDYTNEAGDFLDLATRVDLLADERDHLAFEVGRLAALAVPVQGEP